MLRDPVVEPEPGGIRRGFEDGLGRRYRPGARFESDVPLEILCFRHEITDVPAFEFALRERVARLSDFHHPCFVRTRKIDRLNDERGTVTLMADGAAGDRLINILTDVEHTGRGLDLNAALCLIRQLLSAIAALHRSARVAHGAVAPERLFVTPRGQLLVVEYSLGAALEQLKYTRDRYWKDLRIALPMEAGLARFDERADLAQVGTSALSLLLSRPLRDAEYPQQVEHLIASACERLTGAEQESRSLREWLRRTLQLDGRNAFRSLPDAQTAFEHVLSANPKYRAEPDAVESFMQRYHGLPPLGAQTQSTPHEQYEPLLQEVDSSHVSDEVTDEHDQRADLPDSTTEQDDPMRSTQAGTQRSGRVKWIAAGAVVLAAAAAGLFASQQYLSPAVPPVTTGTMTVNTDPPGVEVEIDGTVRGRSPLSLSLPAGAHTLVVRGDGESRTIPITLAAGAEISQYLDLPKAGAAFGQLKVRTEPAGARISIDGTPLGKTPMTIIELQPGEHIVTLESDLGAVTQKVMIEAGVAASLVVPMNAPPGAVASGWVAVTAPLVVDLLEHGRLLGNSGIDRIMLPAGRHEIELVNEHLGYRETRTVQVSPGRTAAISVTLPKGTVSLNAIPWASVTIDGESIGDTPIGNFPLTVGPHEVIFRNAALGEQRRVITVTTRAPVRLSVDLTRQ